jgi:hypothetical protein
MILTSFIVEVVKVGPSQYLLLVRIIVPKTVIITTHNIGTY